jgi:hypothetical protein
VGQFDLRRLRRARTVRFSAVVMIVTIRVTARPTTALAASAFGHPTAFARVLPRSQSQPHVASSRTQVRTLLSQRRAKRLPSGSRRVC